jgi:hypothetical protein
MSRILQALASEGEVARSSTLRRRGVTARELTAAVGSGEIRRLRPGWYASHRADHDQCRAVMIGGRVGCVSALAHFGVWSGVERALHVQMPVHSQRPRLEVQHVRGSAIGVWHPSVPARRRRERLVRLADTGSATLHWTPDGAPATAQDWIVSPQAALAQSLGCLDREHAMAAIDSALHEGLMTRRDVDALLRRIPSRFADLVDRHTGRPESGVESLFVRRVAAEGFDVRSQFELPGVGRFDGVIEGCVLFEVDGRAHHVGAPKLFDDRDRTLSAQALGVPVLRPSAIHVLDHWPSTVAAVARVVADASLVRRAHGLPPLHG